ncbi:endocuticle structural glycoprotein SgAbd-5-like [Harmonia axyridis]|uniref:endocuticle structural glycoprotein SgAbd-5-like n=1 Tax=Harmonia axyridis TaxID=115357 RepID=UPI001E279A4A|nr:endocuticle structural glycoprotein SgAbd-5-like [Harmonia axyridis]
MKMIVALFAVMALAHAAPQNQADKDAIVTKYDSNNIGVDGYDFVYETSNGISQQEQGSLVNPGTENESIQVRGQYSYVGADGRTYTVIYVADENGFQPQGEHIPK